MPRGREVPPIQKNLLIPKINNWALVKDNSRDIRVGKIIEILKSDKGEIRKISLNINETNGIYPVTNKRFLEACNDLNLNELNEVSNDDGNLNKGAENKIERPQRKAAIVARSKLKGC